MPFQVHGHDQIPILLGHGGEHAVAVDAGVVDHCVQVAKTGQRLFDGVEAVVVVGDVGGIHHRLAAGRGDFRHDFGGGGFVDVIDDDAGAFTRQHPCMGSSQAAAGAGDDYYPAFAYFAH